MIFIISSGDWGIAIHYFLSYVLQIVLLLRVKIHIPVEANNIFTVVLICVRTELDDITVKVALDIDK